MTAFNVVRFRVKPDREKEFVEAHRRANAEMKGLRSAALVKTGERAYCFVGEWNSFGNIVSARPQMISILDTLRDALEDLGNGLGVTDPISGEVVVQMNVGAKAKPAKNAAKAAPKKAAKKKPARKAAAKKRRR